MLVSVLVLVNTFNSSTWYLKYVLVKSEIGAALFVIKIIFNCNIKIFILSHSPNYFIVSRIKHFAICWQVMIRHLFYRHKENDDLLVASYPLYLRRFIVTLKIDTFINICTHNYDYLLYSYIFLIRIMIKLIID